MKHQDHADFKVLRGAVTELGEAVGRRSIAGRLEIGETHWTFTPLVPFDQEVAYTIVSNGRTAVFEIANTVDYVPLEITGIYPNTREVPANILKWYIQFSKPVNPVKIYDHIYFLDEKGEPIDRSILHLGAPLLSADGTLLTVWIEPGRQKRLLGPHRHLGSVFQPSKNYTLHISETLKDSEGLPMVKSIHYEFTTTESDRIQPAITQWEILSPVAQSRQPLKTVSYTHLTLPTTPYV